MKIAKTLVRLFLLFVAIAAVVKVLVEFFEIINPTPVKRYVSIYDVAPVEDDDQEDFL